MSGSPGPTLPPRPNPGPEAWPEAAWPSAWWALAAAPILGLVAWRFARSRRAVANATGEPMPGVDDSTLSPSERLARLADRVRGRLSERFGAGWSAMTTEELLHALKVAVPDDAFPTGDAVALFRASDRVKFAASPIDDDHLAEAESAATRVLQALEDGARISENGR